MKDRTSEYLKKVCSHINCKASHREIQEELQSHIEELSEEYMEQGHDKEKAVELAIRAMGNSEEIGQRLNKLHKPQTEWVLIGFVSVMAFIGGIVLYIGNQADTLQIVQFERYISYALLGIALMVGLYFFDYTKLEALTLPFYIIAVLLFIFSEIKGIDVNGMNYISLGGVTISCEYITFIFLISLTSFAKKSQKRKGRIRFFVLAVFSTVLVIIAGGISQALIMAAGCGALYLSAKLKEKGTFCYSKGTIACVVLFAVFLIYNLTNASLEVMGDGSITDYAFLNMVTSLGIVAGAVFIILTVAFIIRIFQMIRKIKNSYGYYLSMAAGTSLAIQFCIHILMNLNLLPAMNINLPFVSYGGTSYMISMGLVGIILSVWRRNNIIGYTPSPERSCEKTC